MALFPEITPDAIYLARDNVNEPLATFAHFEFELEGVSWPSVEHYYQAMKFDDLDYREQIRAAKHPKTARKLGRKRRRGLREDWSKVREVVMTRGVYIKCRTHPEVAQLLLDTGEQTLVESSQYDYFWGCGRDRRGENKYGKVLMNVRLKLLQEAAE